MAATVYVLSTPTKSRSNANFAGAGRPHLEAQSVLQLVSH